MTQKNLHIPEAIAIIESASASYPDSRNLARHRLELLLKFGDEKLALIDCQDFLARFGVDEEILDTGLNLIKKRVKLSKNPTVSLCMIVKNEERHIAKCLASIRPVVDEMVIVDTGSNDKTVAIATVFGAEIYTFNWNGSFSHARNFAIEKATGSWILVMDADERLSDLDYDKFRHTIAKANIATDAFSVPIRNYSNRSHISGWQSNDGAYKNEEAANGWYPAARVRIFPNDQRIRYDGVVHELVEHSLRNFGFSIRTTEFVVHHYGEIDNLPANLYEKQLRYYELGKEKLAREPENLAALAELATQAGELGFFEEELSHWDKLLAIRHNNVEALFGKGHALINLKRYAEALLASKQAFELDPQHHQAAYNYGLCVLYCASPSLALPLIKQLLQQDMGQPQLLAIAIMLMLASGDTASLQLYMNKLADMGYDFSDYFTGRLETIKQLGNVELAETITQQAISANLIKSNTDFTHSSIPHHPFHLSPRKKDDTINDLDVLEQLQTDFKTATAAMANGDEQTAITIYKACLETMPELHDARLNLAICFCKSQQFDAACRELTTILCFQPEHIQARLMLGKTLLKLGRITEGMEQLTLLNRLYPHNPQIWTSLAEGLYLQQRYNDARKWIEKALELKPDSYESLQTLATIERTENPEKALSIYRRLTLEKPEDFQTRLFYATLLLSLGQFEDGWKEFEQRIPTLQMSEDVLSIPRWNGEQLQGKSIVLVAEQGYGDALQFIRYVPLIAEKNSRIMVLCHDARIKPILATVPGVESVVIPKEPLPFMPDYHCPLMSLPFILGTTLESIPATIPYLFPNQELQKLWQNRLAIHPGIKIGLVWGGNRAQGDNSRRSVPFESLLPLLEIPEITFVSLQVGPDALKHQPKRHAVAMLDVTDELHDFADTAALVSCLDMVISICSGVTHLCGALGVNTWVMLQYDADWRWLRQRGDSPWYPGMRLFRQLSPGDWDWVLVQIKHELELLRDFGNCDVKKKDCPAENYSPTSAADASYRAGLNAYNNGDLKQAEVHFKQGIALDGNHADLLNGLATLLDKGGKTEEAVTLYRKALDVKPDTPLILFNLANSLRKSGMMGDAELLYRRTIDLDSAFYPAISALGNLLFNQENLDEAEELMSLSLKLNHTQPDLLCDLGALMAKQGNKDLAVEHLRQALSLDPEHPAALNQLGMILMWQNRLQEAELLFRRAIEAKPDYIIAMNNLGVLLHWEGRLNEAEDIHRKVIKNHPEKGTPHFNLALVLLSEAKFGEGWQEYEYRFLKENAVPMRHTGIPRWQGEDIMGGKILVHAEQGYGDTIQFARYLPLLAKRGFQIIFECQDKIIAPLFACMECVTKVLVRGEEPPNVDFQIPLLSLPLILGQDAWNEPVVSNYLTAEPQCLKIWQERFADIKGFRIGLVWSGRRGQDNNHNRMIPPSLFCKLAELPHVSFVNLLVGIDDSEADAALAPLNMYDPRAYLHDFADTAAALASLDMLVSVDTATAHLAGAMGIQAHVLIPYNADWRWTFGLPDCPLYSSITLYKQQVPFVWEPIIDELAKKLKQLTQEHHFTSYDKTENLLLENSAKELLQSAIKARDMLDFEDALACYLKAFEADPTEHDAMFGIGATLQLLNRPKEAQDWYDGMTSLMPDNVPLHCNRALCLLTLGRYHEGWHELQWRKKLITEQLPPYPFLAPELMESIDGKSVLIHTEQGFGDTIHLIRYIPMLAKYVAKIFVTAPKELLRLLSFIPGIEKVIPNGEILPVADFQTLMLDLPWVFGTTTDTIPAAVPYLTVPVENIEKWRHKIKESYNFKVGIVWKSGKGDALNQKLRSIELEQLEPLFGNSRIDWYSLQVGKDKLDSRTLLRYSNLYDLTDEITDFADSAALIMNLDHVITIDSAVAHLAGALGKTVSLLLPEFREWRWMDSKGSSLWYPNVKLLHKPQNNKNQQNFLEKISKSLKTIETMPCRICNGESHLFYKNQRSFYRCTECSLIFTNESISINDSEQHYKKQHDIKFDFARFAAELIETVKPHKNSIKSIMDYGAGSGKLSEELRKLGYDVDQYEPMYDGKFEPRQFSKTYDLVISNQVIEHVDEIIFFLDNIVNLCDDGGLICIYTFLNDSVYSDCHAFANWWYKDDLTHVSFFNSNTFRFLGEFYNNIELKVVALSENGICFRKKFIYLTEHRK